MVLGFGWTMSLKVFSLSALPVPLLRQVFLKALKAWQALCFRDIRGKRGLRFGVRFRSRSGMPFGVLFGHFLESF